jgi:hypothetical protein
VEDTINLSVESDGGEERDGAWMITIKKFNKTMIWK